MKKYSILSIMLLLSLVVLYTGCGNKAGNITANSSGNTERAAKVITVDGKVAITKTDGKTLYAFNGMSINQSDKIKTEENSSLILEIDDDKQLKIPQNSELTVSSLQLSKDSKTENTRLELDTGAVWINIKNKLSSGSKFEIKTPTAVMGVRGTVFSVLHEGDTSLLAVIDGTVTATKTVEIMNPAGKIIKKDIEAVVEKNKQVMIDDSIQSEEDFDIQPIYPENLDPFTLENVKELIKTQPDIVDDIFKEEISYLNKTNKKQRSVPGAGMFNLPSDALSSSGIEMKLPDGYPDSVVPVIPGGKVVFGYKESSNYTVVLDVAKSFKDVKDYYAGVIGKNEIIMQQDIEGVYFTMGTKSGYSVIVYVIPEKAADLNGVGVAIILASQR